MPQIVVEQLVKNYRISERDPGFIGTIRGVFSFFKMMGGEEVARPDAVRVQAIMALLCAIFIALAVNSFVQARRNRARA